MIIEIPDDNSIVKWKKNDKEDWKSAEISDLIAAHEESEVYMNGKDYDLYLEGYKQGKKDFERPQGEWIYERPNEKTYSDFCFCSVCHETKFYKSNFCPNCGAKMKGGAE